MTVMHTKAAIVHRRTRPPNMIAKANTCGRVFARPHRRNTAIALPRELLNMIHGYGNRSLKYPIRICPITPEELNSARTIVAERGEAMEVVNTAMYNETGKNDSDWNMSVMLY